MRINERDNGEPKDLMLYSQRAIGIATFFGGPLAAGILMRQNFLNVNNKNAANNSLILGILGSIVLISIVVFVPERYLSTVPDSAYPLIYTSIIWVIVDRIFGHTIEEHKRNEGTFYSAWKAVGIGIICSVLFIGSIALVFMFPPTNVKERMEAHEAVFEQFSENEDEAIKIFELLEREDSAEITSFLIETGIPKWQENLKLVEKLDSIGEIEYKYLEPFRAYCELRISSYQLIGQSFTTDDDGFYLEFLKESDKIDSVLLLLSE